MPRNRTNNASAVSVPNFDRVILRGGGKTITRYIQVMRLPHECSDWLSMARDRHLAAWFTSDWIPYLYFTIMISTGQEPWRERNNDTKIEEKKEKKKRRKEEKEKTWEERECVRVFVWCLCQKVYKRKKSRTTFHSLQSGDHANART